MENKLSNIMIIIIFKNIATMMDCLNKTLR